MLFNKIKEHYEYETGELHDLDAVDRESLMILFD